MNKALIESLVSLTALREPNHLRWFLTDVIGSLPYVVDLVFVQRTQSRALKKPCDNNKYEFVYHRIRNNGAIEDSPNYEFKELIAMHDNPRLSITKNEPSVYPIVIDSTTTEYLIFQLNELNDDIRFFFDTISHVYKNHTELLLAAEIDELTGLKNRKAFDRFCNRLFNPKIRVESTESKPVSEACFAMIDMDHFKRVNDEFGHLYGDEVLLLFAQLMMREFRTTDYLFRYGGEEFVVILTDSNSQKAHSALERFRVAAESFNYPQVGRKTVSIGYTSVASASGNNTPLIIDQADQALYYSKENGRNQTNCFKTLVDSNAIQTKEPKDVLYF